MSASPTPTPSSSPSPTATPYVPTGAEALTSSKASYWTTDVAGLSATGFQAGATITLAMVEPSGKLGLHWSVDAASDGSFTTAALILGGAGSYEVRAYDASWTADLSVAPLASVAFAAQAPTTQGLIVTFVSGTSSAAQDAAIARDGGKQTLAVPVLGMRMVDVTSDVATSVFNAYLADPVVALV